MVCIRMEVGTGEILKELGVMSAILAVSGQCVLWMLSNKTRH